MSIETFKQIVDEYDDLIGRDYVLDNGEKDIYTLEGIIWGKDDIYYVLQHKEGAWTTWVSCVMDLENAGYTLTENENDCYGWNTKDSNARPRVNRIIP
jgi:hypothetical protein